MSTARSFTFTGALLAKPPQGGGRSMTLVFDFCSQYDQSSEGAIHVSGTALAPYALELSGITSVYLLGLTVLAGGPLTLLLDSAVGIAQAVPVLQEIFLSNKGGVPITRVQIVGTADIEFMLAGT